MSMLRCVFLLLFLHAIQCQNASNWSKLSLNDTVISPYRSAIILFNNNMVDRLMNVNLTSGSRSLYPLVHELYCAAQEIHLNLKQAIVANDNFTRLTGIHVDQLLASNARLKKETKQKKTDIKKLNMTVESARDRVRLAEKIKEEKDKFFSGLIGYEMKKSMARCDPDRRSTQWRGGFSGSYDSDEAPLSKEFCDSVRFSTYHVHAYRSSRGYYSILNNLDVANKNLTKEQNQLKQVVEEYESAQSQLMDSSKQLKEVNMILKQRRTAGKVATALNIHFKQIENHVKTVSDPSQRLFDVLKNLLDFKTVIEPLNFIYEKLLKEQMLEPISLTTSKQTINKVNRKLVLLAALLPELQNPQKQFDQPCAYSTPRPVTPQMALELHETTSSISNNETSSFRVRLAVLNQVPKQQMDFIDDHRHD